ncbi:hypothetical protein K8I85_09295 [bacterium]|nr:hypothetical protein [bacterium]
MSPTTPAAAAPTTTPPVPFRWSARKSHPVVLFYVTLVFLAFAALAHFGFHSPTGAKALGLALLAYLASMAPRAFARIEYRLTDTGLDGRPATGRPREFREVFRFDQLRRVVPMRHGFRYSKRLPPSGRWRRFWREHVSDAYSGEVHAESEDRSRVLRLLADRGVHRTGPIGSP